MPAQNREITPGDIISPESGIHRPSYNGAPARQTGLAKKCPVFYRRLHGNAIS